MEKRKTPPLSCEGVFKRIKAASDLKHVALNRTQSRLNRLSSSLIKFAEELKTIKDSVNESCTLEEIFEISQGKGAIITTPNSQLAMLVRSAKEIKDTCASAMERDYRLSRDEAQEIVEYIASNFKETKCTVTSRLTGEKKGDENEDTVFEYEKEDSVDGWNGYYKLSDNVDWADVFENEELFDFDWGEDDDGYGLAYSKTDVVAISLL
jgi:hypothetical protein